MMLKDLGGDRYLQAEETGLQHPPYTLLMDLKTQHF